jgi:hypothetical protein
MRRWSAVVYFNWVSITPLSHTEIGKGLGCKPSPRITNLYTAERTELRYHYVICVCVCGREGKQGLVCLKENRRGNVETATRGELACQGLYL